MKKVWRDIHMMKIFYLFLCIGIFSYIIFYFLTKEPKQSKLILAFLIGGYSMFILFNIIRTKLTYITNDGIMVGNAPNDSYDNFKLAKETIFIKWTDLKSVKIVRREVHKTLRDVLINFIIVNTKDNREYESFIANPKGFVKAIKDLKKSHLFTKNSKYLDLISKK